MVPVLLLLAVRPAAAAPVGDPIPDPATGRLRTEAQIDVESSKVRDTECEGEDGCLAWDQATTTAAAAQLALLRGLGVAAEVGRTRDQVDEADFDAAGLAFAGAVRGAVPLSRVWWVRGQVRYDLATPSGGGVSGRRGALTAGLGLAWGDTEGGFAGHLGVQRALWWDHVVEPLADSDGPSSELVVTTRQTVPLTGTAGFSFASRPLGAAWSGAPRATARFEARVGASWGAGAAMGLAF